MVRPGDVLVGKVTPKNKSELTPEEKLLHAIFGRKAGDVRDTSLRVPPGIYGTIVGAEVFSRRSALTEKDKDEENARARTHRRDRILRLSSRWSARSSPRSGVIRLSQTSTSRPARSSTSTPACPTTKSSLTRPCR